MRDKKLIEERNAKLASLFTEMNDKGLRYNIIIATLSRTFFLSEFQVMNLIRQMVRNGKLKKEDVHRRESTNVDVNVQLSL